MKTWKRVTLVSVVLLGGTSAFAFWTLHQFNDALDAIAWAPAAVVLTARPAAPIQDSLISTTTATTTPEVIAVMGEPFLLDIAFPGKSSELYSGCTYAVTWNATSTAASLSASLINFSTRKSASSTVSGLPKENKLTDDQQHLLWKVGSVLPGAYYIAISSVNGATTTEKSYKFKINEMPKGLSIGERRSLCTTTGGTF
jgi:hypothetical protein